MLYCSEGLLVPQCAQLSGQQREEDRRGEASSLWPGCKYIPDPRPIRGEEHMKHVVSAMLAMTFILSLPYSAAAQTEVTVIGPGGVRAAIEKLIPGFEAKTGYKVKGTYGSGGGTHAQVVKGDVFDVVIVQPPYQDVIASGNVMKDTEKELATVAVGVAVKKGAPRPDISNAAAVKKLLLNAKSVSYPNPSGGAAAGVSFEQTLKQLGIFDQVKAKYTPGQATLAAKGEVEVSVTFLSEIDDPGIDIIGPLPKEISTPTGLVAFVHSKAKDPVAAKAFVQYFSGPEAAAVYKSLRMAPGR
jgi:molybdate transport system substrate-binding protein